MRSQLENISKVWSTIKTIFSVPHTEKEYLNLVKILDSLIDEVGDDQDHQLAAVMETIGNLIASYEEQKYIPNKSSALESLKYLIKEHGLKQADLKELGSQGVVSEILSGKRTLNLEQVKKMSSRFHVSLLVFI